MVQAQKKSKEDLNFISQTDLWPTDRLQTSRKEKQQQKQQTLGKKNQIPE